MDKIRIDWPIFKEQFLLNSSQRSTDRVSGHFYHCHVARLEEDEMIAQECEYLNKNANTILIIKTDEVP